MPQVHTCVCDMASFQDWDGAWIIHGHRVCRRTAVRLYDGMVSKRMIFLLIFIAKNYICTINN